MAAAVDATPVRCGWLGRGAAVLALLTATAVLTAAPASAPEAVGELRDVAGPAVEPVIPPPASAVAVPVEPEAGGDFAVVATAPATATAGVPTAYHLAVTNLAAASGLVTLVERLPAGFELRDVDARPCAVAADGTLTCTLAVTGLTTRVVTVSGFLTIPGVLSMTATVSSVGDADPGNDTSAASTTVTGTPCSNQSTWYSALLLGLGVRQHPGHTCAPVEGAARPGRAIG